MKKVVLTLAMLAMVVVTGGAAMAQDVNEPTPQEMPERPALAANTLDKALIASERKIHEAVAKGDKAIFLSLIAPNAWLADAGGFMKASDLATALDQIKVTTWAIGDEKVSWIDANTAILTYKWTGAGTSHGQPMPPAVYASTVWTRKGEKWLAVYHQESEAKK
jgi:hypothetical protein